MKVFHDYELGKPPENKAVRKAGASMLAYGTLAYGAVVKKLEPAKAMGYSLVAIIANLFLQDVLQDDKSKKHRLFAGGLALVFADCAYQLINDGMSDFAALTPVTILGILSILSMLSPAKMMSLLEYKSEDAKGKGDTPDDLISQAVGVHTLPIIIAFPGKSILSMLFPKMLSQLANKSEDAKGKGDTPEDYQMKFITQAIGMHTICYVALCAAFFLEKDPYHAVGYAAGLTTLLGIPAYFVAPNLRKSNAPLWPMYPPVALFAYTAYKLGFTD